jgi:hypothetical protein
MNDNLPALLEQPPDPTDEELAALPLPADATERAVAQDQIRRHGGMWKPGQSGNPAGRPKGAKNHIKELQRELEIAVRDNLNPRVIRGILERVAEEALAGDMKAAKLILDKVLSNAGDGGDESNTAPPAFIFQVKNLTLKHPGKDDSPTPGVVIDVTPQELPK